MIKKIAAIADIHWGASSTMTTKLNDNLNKFFLDKLKILDPDIIAICGDYFHFKLPMTSVEAQLAVSFMGKLKQTFPNKYILLIKGTETHDLNQLEIFRQLEDKYFRIYNNFTIDIIDDMKVLIIPEEYFPNKDTYSEVLNPTIKYDWVFFHGLFSHAGNYAAKVGNKFNKICFNVSDFANNVYGRVTGGHIHDHIVKDNVDYCGSFDAWIFGEKPEKGFMYYEYDTVNKTVTHNEFILNEGRQIYKTISHKELPCDNIDELIKSIFDILSDQSITALRIKVSRNNTVTDTEIQNLVSASMKFSNVVLYKEAINVIKDKTSEEKKEDEDRKKRINEYSDLTFNQITKKFAKEVLNYNISDEQINEVLSN